MVSRILLGKYDTIDDIFWFCVEVCVDFLAYFLIHCPCQRDTGMTSENYTGLKGLNKVTLLPSRGLI